MALSRLPADHEEVSSRSLKEAAMGLEAGLGEALRTDYFMLREEYGCPDMDPLAAGLVTMELHRGDGSPGTFLGVQAGLAMRSIAMLGSEEQKQRWLPDMARLAKLDAFEGIATIQNLIVGRDITGVSAFTAGA
jgi:Acyl-CoA dehydrogenase, N-terminal domain